MLGVHGVVGQQAQIVEHVGAQELRLVDDEHRQQLGLLDLAGDLGADGAVGGGAGTFGREAEFPGDRRPAAGRNGRVDLSGLWWLWWVGRQAGAGADHSRCLCAQGK